MSEIASFKTVKTFADKVHFPYGFSRSGDFTSKQANLLERHGQAYKSLEDGSRQPETEEERNFVKFCQGERPAESEHEKVWARYRSQSVGKSFYVSMAGAVPIASAASQVSYESEPF